MIGGWGIEVALRWMPLDFTDDKSVLVQVMAWCRQATSHYLSPCWLRMICRQMASLGLNELRCFVLHFSEKNILVPYCFIVANWQRLGMASSRRTKILHWRHMGVMASKIITCQRCLKVEKKSYFNCVQIRSSSTIFLECTPISWPFGYCFVVGGGMQGDTDWKDKATLIFECHMEEEWPVE